MPKQKFSWKKIGSDMNIVIKNEEENASNSEQMFGLLEVKWAFWASLAKMLYLIDSYKCRNRDKKQIHAANISFMPMQSSDSKECQIKRV